MAKTKKKATNIYKTELIGEAGVIRLECNPHTSSLYITGIGNGECSFWASTHDLPEDRKKTLKAAAELIAQIETFVKNVPAVDRTLDSED